MSVARSATRIHKDLVGSLDGEDAFEARVDVRENGHDCCPDQSTVIVLRGLDKTAQSYDREESHEITDVELDV